MNKERTTLRREGYLHQIGATGLPTSSARLPCVVFLSLPLYLTIINAYLSTKMWQSKYNRYKLEFIIINQYLSCTYHQSAHILH